MRKRGFEIMGLGRHGACLAVLLWVGLAGPRPHRLDQLPNGTVLGCATCHVSALGGVARNPFGQTVEAEFLSVADETGDVLWGPSLADRDSDGDGFSNGQELGDPDGIFDAGDAASVTAPGDAEDFPVKQMVGAHPDLNDDGIVDDLDLSLLKETTAETYGGEIDTAVFLDGDGSADFDDVVILLQNIDVISEGASTSLLPDLGPNEEALPALDLEGGNGVADGVMSTVVEGADQTFDVEVFLDPLASPVSAIEQFLSFDSTLVVVEDFEPAGGSDQVYVRSQDRVVLVSPDGVTLGDGGYVGRVRFRSLDSITRIPVRVGLVQYRGANRKIRSVQTRIGTGRRSGLEADEKHDACWGTMVRKSLTCLKQNGGYALGIPNPGASSLNWSARGSRPTSNLPRVTDC